MYDINGIPADISLTPLNPAVYTQSQDAQVSSVEAAPVTEPTEDPYTDGTVNIRRGQF